MPDLTMNDGRAIAALGCGTYLVPDDDAARIACDAVAAGYALVDTAAFHGNERGVAEGSGDSPAFVTTKLRRDRLRYDGALRGFETSFARLGRIDLYMAATDALDEVDARMGPARQGCN
jgi:2,5-diketo-D-gluconate reductase A